MGPYPKEKKRRKDTNMHNGRRGETRNTPRGDSARKGKEVRRKWGVVGLGEKTKTKEPSGKGGIWYAQ